MSLPESCLSIFLLLESQGINKVDCTYTHGTLQKQPQVKCDEDQTALTCLLAMDQLQSIVRESE